MDAAINHLQNYLREVGPAGIFILIFALGFWAAIIVRVVLDVIYIFRHHRSW